MCTRLCDCPPLLLLAPLSLQVEGARRAVTAAQAVCAKLEKDTPYEDAKKRAKVAGEEIARAQAEVNDYHDEAADVSASAVSVSVRRSSPFTLFSFRRAARRRLWRSRS